MKQTERTSNDNPVYKAFASGDNDLALARNVVEYLEKRFTSIEIKIEDDYLADKIAQEVMKNNNELYKKFSDEMRVQNEKFSDEMRVQNEKFSDEIREHSEKFNDAMREQNAKFNDTIRSQNAKFNDEMRAQNKEFNDEIREQSEKFNDTIRIQGEKFNAAMLAQNEKFYSKLQMHTYWTVGTILVAAGIIIALLQL